MIITCTKCSKKFEINSDLIPQNGRLLECSACTHQWFFKKEIVVAEQNINNEKIKINTPNKTIPTKSKKKTKALEKIEKTSKNTIKSNPKKVENYTSALDMPTADKKIGFLNIIFLFIISFAAFIVFMDTFKTPVSIFFPEIEVVLYNLYETFKDVILFLKDLV
jgi:predicted Zn finger-like uncharacterized protein